MPIALINSDNWFCSEECMTTGVDHVLEYSKGLLWKGLYHLANRDAIREGDGTMMIKFWKCDLVNFWNKGHNKYVIAAHLLLASK